MIELKDKATGQVKFYIHEFVYNGIFMDERSVTATLESAAPIDFKIGDYFLYRGETFVLNYLPAKEKVASSNSIGNAFTYSDVKFNSLADELTRCDFLDYVTGDNNIHYTGLSNFSFYAETIETLAMRIKANLDRLYGQNVWTIIVPQTAIDASLDHTVSVSSINCWNALALVNTQFKMYFTITGRTITIGEAGTYVGGNNAFILRQGKNNGLFSLKQTANSEAQIITRLRAYGSKRNLPYKYYNKLGISESMYSPNLMLPAFRTVKGDVYIESVEGIAKYGVREGTKYFDGSDNEYEEVYPTLTGMKADQLPPEYNISLKAGDNGFLDEILVGSVSEDDGVIPQPSTLKGFFEIAVKDLGFDILDHKSTTPATISMKSGPCAGYEFEIISCIAQEISEGGYKQYLLTCKRYTNSDINVAYPNTFNEIAAGNKFVILNIEMPDAYIVAAEQRLENTARLYLTANDHSKYIYEPELDENFLARNPEFADSIVEGKILKFADDDLGIDTNNSVFIDTLEIREGGTPVPTYKVTLTDEKTAGVLDKIRNSVEVLATQVGGLSEAQIKSFITLLGKTLFLSKTENDTAAELIKFAKGIEIGNVTGTSGGSIYSDSNGNANAIFDNIEIRKRAFFKELVIEKLSHVGGQLILSPASMTCTAVERVGTAFKCFFDKGDNGEVHNEFVKDDMAICQVFTGSGQKYYWRLVLEISEEEGWILLSNEAKDGVDEPAVGDRICQLGNVDSVLHSDRQSAQILSSYGDDAPSYKQYGGIDSFTLVGKELTQFTRKGNDIIGKLHIEAGSDGWENLKGLTEAFDGISVGTVNLLRNTGFTGDYESADFTPDTILSEDLDLYSQQLKYWTGVAIVDDDIESHSGFSVTITDNVLSQPLYKPLIVGESYVLSFKAKGEVLNFAVAGLNYAQPLSGNYERYIIKFKADTGIDFKVSGTGTFCELQLERGTLVSDWSRSPYDNDKTLAQFQALNYVTSAIKDGSVDVLGGLILASMLQVGNYEDGILKEITAGMSGVCNSGDDVAFWAGGTLEKAISAVMNPELTKGVAQAVITHGGKAILNEAVVRGTIFANDGEFSGTVRAKEGFFGLLQLIDGDIIGVNEKGVEALRITMSALPDLNTLSTVNTSTVISGAETQSSYDLFNTMQMPSPTKTYILSTAITLDNEGYVLVDAPTSTVVTYPRLVSDYSLTVEDYVCILKNGTQIATGAIGTNIMVNATGILTVELRTEVTLLDLRPGDSYHVNTLQSWRSIKALRPVAKTLVGSNGLFSMWSSNKYFYYSDSKGLEVRFGNNLFKVASDGVKKSTDGGTTWS